MDNSPKATIHQFTIIIHEGRRSHRFQLSCKSGRDLPWNTAVKEMWGVDWRGDNFVLRVGKINPLRPVDMWGQDKARVNYAVRK